MKRAGIKVWVITGDKVETSINIGVSAGLLDHQMNQQIIDESEISSLKSKLESIQLETVDSQDLAIIVSG